MFVNVDNDEDSLFIQPLDEIVDIIEHEQVNLEYQNNHYHKYSKTVPAPPKISILLKASNELTYTFRK
ncbi:unnamed protein product [Acanthoscelides obtectus]|uniref:Uncharacterized protein n=1 Tax=Acanthoscelides obtectus TaxID=200917 RepID=A0A9P0M7I9_ACAOB|nr:unnamed protein product [Acanthoscelides obtectus]CAK1637739.1 hypothetical protein AOBTE_LOCUS10168 [Acanthoscelides obtectus]